ncbi:hypothetical protein LOTGIDRAFT_141858, partial [Lottia gigantea]
IDGDITLNEIKEALGHIKLDRSPGSDGFCVNFYITFFDILGPFLVKLYKYRFEHNLLPPSLRISYISLLCKDKNNKNLMKNWRPISLLNYDYKILFSNSKK